jgi:hypothetical protein
MWRVTVTGALLLAAVASCSLEDSGGGLSSAGPDSGTGGTLVNSDASLGGSSATGGLGGSAAGGSSGGANLGGQAGSAGGGTGGSAGAVLDAAVDSGTGRVTTGLQLLYDFDDGSGDKVKDTAGGKGYDLTIVDIGNVAWGSGSLTVNSETRIENTGQPKRVHDACKKSKAITLEAWVTPKNTTQGGYARVFSNSKDQYDRNFTLLQMDNSWGVRMRTTTNVSGVPEIQTSLGTVSTNATHLVFTRAANGASVLYVDNVPLKNNILSGDFGNWDASYGFLLANEFVDSRPWAGTYHLLAIYSEALSAAQVAQNFLVGP